MDTSKDYYAVLNILPSAEESVIRAAFKALAQRYHPDRYQGDIDEANHKMSELNEAYSVLSNPTSRSAYDAARGVSAQAADFSYNKRESAKQNDQGSFAEYERTSEAKINNFKSAYKAFGSLAIKVIIVFIFWKFVVMIFQSPKPQPPKPIQTPYVSTKPATTSQLQTTKNIQNDPTEILYSSSIRGGRIQLVRYPNTGPFSHITLELQGRTLYESGTETSVKEVLNLEQYDFVLLHNIGPTGADLGYTGVLITSNGKATIIENNDFVSGDRSYEKSLVEKNNIQINLGYENGLRKIATISNGRLSITRVPPASVEQITKEKCDGLKYVFEECSRKSEFGFSGNNECYNVDASFGFFSRAAWAWLKPVSNHPNFNLASFKSLCTDSCLSKRVPPPDIVRFEVCGSNNSE